MNELEIKSIDLLKKVCAGLVRELGGDVIPSPHGANYIVIYQTEAKEWKFRKFK